MDLQLFGRVLGRWWPILAIGLVLAVAGALLATFRVGADGLQYRSGETWLANQDVLVTEPGFPLGRATQSLDLADPAAVPLSPQEQFASSGRLIELASVYAQLSSSDQVIALMEQTGPQVHGELSAEQFTTTGGRAGLPMIRLEALAGSEQEAITLVQRNAVAFQEFIERRQAGAQIPPQDRVVLTSVRTPDSGSLVSSRSIMAPVVVFLGVIALTLGVVFLLENLDPRWARRLRRARPARPQAPEPALDGPAASEGSDLEVDGLPETRQKVGASGPAGPLYSEPPAASLFTRGSKPNGS